ncbi:hypothetical protein AS156_25730 [Bradyrhizobium macuxiense]|uniref:Uncharacterized protein n=1 Tax=Bradyrhizobium macuxiense TaxID=1755647 RepID=A0A109K5U5_9BRAD|nr:hypothetical protein [Bradyrhizobium macuxiense]KWV61133.1 hypothetical protein AS156_25730 [Bradyrhizobium macuxiense]
MNLIMGDTDRHDIKKLASDLASLRATRPSLVNQLADARGSVIALTEQAERYFTEGDDVAATKAIAKINAAETRIKILESATSRLDAEIADATKSHDAAVRMALAEGVAKDKAAALEELRRKIAVASTALTDLSKACEPLHDDSFLVRQVSELIAMLPTDLQGALDHAASEVNFLIDGLRNGSISPMPVEHAPAPAEVVAKQVVETRRMLVLADVKWRHGNEVKAAAKQSTADMPTATADKAERLGYACAVGSPAWKKNNIGRGIVSLHPSVTGIVDLDDENLQQMKVAFGFDQHKVDAHMQERINGKLTQNFAGF